MAFEADPDAALRDLQEPAFIDEWQATPGVLAAIKRSVDRDPRPGRFVVAGSVRGGVDGETWPGTGRLMRVAMHGMTQREVSGTPGVGVIDRIARQDEITLPADRPDLGGYLALAMRGGFPIPALQLDETEQTRWYQSYIEQIVSRDAQQIADGRDPVRLRRYTEALALNHAGIVDDTTLWEAAQINKKTARAYDSLLHNLLVVESVPAWTTNRLKRMTLAPKRYFTDVALALASLSLSGRAAMRRGDLLGRVIDNFVYSEIRCDVANQAPVTRMYHLRQEQGRHEIDLVVEYGGSGVVAVEIKASAAPGRDDARHLAWLRDQLGKDFLAGVVFHTGPRAFELDDRIRVLPICALWG